MKKTIVFIFYSVIFSAFIVSQTIVSVDFQKNSLLTIHGTSNLLSFKLVHRAEKLLGKTITITTRQNQNRIYTSQNQLTIAVKNFTSDNKMALRDFLKLMKSESFPTLQVQLNYLETLPCNEKDKYTKAIAFVNIIITGVTKQYHIPVSMYQHGEFATIDGNKNLSIRDFELTPPVEMLGLLRVSEWIDFDFHLICKITTSKV